MKGRIMPLPDETLKADPAEAPTAAAATCAAGEAITLSAPEICPLYTATRISGVKIGPSPEWLANRLVSIGLRPINNVVDITNYCLFELGHPLHAFDAAKLTGGLNIRRAAEGERLARDLAAKIDGIKVLVDRIEVLSREDIAAYHDRLLTRLRSVLEDNRVTVDENRILTECAIFADRVAVDEELVRLRSHFDVFGDILASGEPAGRKLDFLVQEINRETNTIGSKCQNSSIAKMVVEIKCEIEKIREQIQNIE